MTETHSNVFFSNEKVQEINSDYKPILIADNFATPENIGHVIRLSANIGALKVLVVLSSDLRKSKIKKTAGTAFNHVLVEFVHVEDLENHLPDEYVLTALETAPMAKNLFTEKLPDKLALVLGNEKWGIGKELLKKCKKRVFIPMSGPIKSMNVSHAAAVCIFHWYYQFTNTK